jgi:hypothetical protein
MLIVGFKYEIFAKFFSGTILCIHHVQQDEQRDGHLSLAGKMFLYAPLCFHDMFFQCWKTDAQLRAGFRVTHAVDLAEFKHLPSLRWKNVKGLLQQVPLLLHQLLFINAAFSIVILRCFFQFFQQVFILLYFAKIVDYLIAAGFVQVAHYIGSDHQLCPHLPDPRKNFLNGFFSLQRIFGKGQKIGIKLAHMPFVKYGISCPVPLRLGDRAP